MRHAHPTTVRIVLLEEIAQWTMSVIDDGRGMTLSPDLYAQQGYGLNNMRERAGAIGGEFLIESKPGEGTRIVVNLPRPHAANVSKLKANERRGYRPQDQRDLADDHPWCATMAAIVNQQPDMQVVAPGYGRHGALELTNSTSPT